MKFTELHEVIEAYNEAIYLSPSAQAIHFGCDCGCGGDSYTKEAWDQAEAEAQELMNQVKEFCHKHQIYFDIEDV